MNDAILSDDGRYRYSLTRSIGMGDRTVVFIGVNPSTADAWKDDSTIRKMVGFARRWGYDRITVGNIFAYRSTDVRKLANQSDPVGPDNSQHLDGMLASAQLVVPCWGSIDKIPDRWVTAVGWVRSKLVSLDVPVQCLGRTRKGDPKHPLYLGYDTPLEDWP